jgi:hypothetical protein
MGFTPTRFDPDVRIKLRQDGQGYDCLYYMILSNISILCIRVRVHDYNMDGPPPNILLAKEMQRMQYKHMHSKLGADLRTELVIQCRIYK